MQAGTWADRAMAARPKSSARILPKTSISFPRNEKFTKLLCFRIVQRRISFCDSCVKPPARAFPEFSNIDNQQPADGKMIAGGAMKKAELTLPEIALVAGTRAMLGAGAGLLLADRLNDDQRKAVGWTLLTVGAISTIPLLIEVLSKRR
jgi:hypothetical protein